VSHAACARIGAIHSVVYAGLGHTALRDRITDAEAKVVIVETWASGAADSRAQAIVDEAVDNWNASRDRGVFARQTELTGRAKSTSTIAQVSSGVPAEKWTRKIALPALHLGFHRQAERSSTRTWRVHGGNDLPFGELLDVASATSSGAHPILAGRWPFLHHVCSTVRGVTTLFAKGNRLSNPGIAWEIVEKYGVTKMFTARPHCECSCDLARVIRRRTTNQLARDRLRGRALNPEAWRWRKPTLPAMASGATSSTIGGRPTGRPALALASMAMRPEEWA